MDIYRITFIGHREIHAPHIEDRIEEIIKEKLRHKEYVEFFMGRNGDFDVFSASAVKRAQKLYGNHNSTLVLVQPYRMKDDVYYGEYYDEVQYPLDTNTHPKSAITKRNRWMIENTDMLIAYVEDGRAGGAATTLKYAEKMGVEIINLALREESC